MAVKIPNFSRYLNNDGKPEAGLLLYTYQAGTLVPKITYTDVVGNTPNPNPIPVDSNGYLPASIYGVGTYRLILKDSKGDTLVDRDLIQLRDEDDILNISHDDLLNVQGGTTGEFYHLTLPQVNSIASSEARSINNTDRLNALNPSVEDLLSVVNSNYPDLVDAPEYWNGSGLGGAKWRKTGNTGSPGTLDITNGLLYDANGDEREILIDGGEIDIASFGAKSDGSTNCSDILRDVFLFARNTHYTIVAVGDYLISNTTHTRLNCYNSIDFTKSRLSVLNTEIEVFDGRLSSETTLSLDETDFDKTKLVLGNTSIYEAVNDKTVFDDFYNCYISIKSESVYIKRYPATDSSYDLYPNSISKMSKIGRLSSPIIFDFTSDTNVTITLRKLPESRIKIALGEVEFTSTGITNFLRISRDMVDVEFINTKNISGTTSNFGAVIIIQNVSDVYLYNLALPGNGETNTKQLLVTPVTAYDIIINKCYNIILQSVYGGLGWKNIDGNNIRKLSILNSVVSSLNGHFNVSDVKIQNCTIYDKSCDFGTGSHDSSITFESCDFISYQGSMVDIRRDYGELRGKINILNCNLTIPNDTDSSTFSIVSLGEDAISDSGATIGNYIQPREYYLPNIFIRNLNVVNAGDIPIRFIEFEDHVYESDQKLNFPNSIKIDGVYCNDSSDVILDIDSLPYNADSMDNIDIDIRNVRLKNGLDKTPLNIKIEFITSPIPNKLKYDLRVRDSYINSSGLFGHHDSTIDIKDSYIIGLFDGKNGSDETEIGYRNIDNCEFIFSATSDVSNLYLLAETVSKVTNCTFDCSLVKVITSANVPIAQLVHVSNNNIGIGSSASTIYTPLSNIRNSEGKTNVLNDYGEPGIYDLDTTGPIPKLEPSWKTTITVTKIGTYYYWTDATGDLRSKSTYPTTDLDGTVVGTQT